MVTSLLVESVGNVDGILFLVEGLSAVGGDGLQVVAGRGDAESDRRRRLRILYFLKFRYG
jgi:hypothetical protein